MPKVRLKGLLPQAAPRFVRRGDPVPPPDPSELPLEIADARAVQSGAATEGGFFDDHGFILLDHRSAVRDWRESEQPEILRIYRPEIEAIVRDRLFPGRRVDIDQSLPPIRRGPGENSVIYADRVHQDFGLTAADYALGVEARNGTDAARQWRERYDRDAVERFVMISFWRTAGMRAPLRHLPIALCDPRTVALSDVVADAATGAGGDNYHIALRFDPAQRWYWYPEMTCDELLAFKLCECAKDDPRPTRLRSVFHSAFADPDAPADAELRQSCEHRIGVTVLRD